MRRCSRKEGSVLIIALWSVCLLSFLAVILGFQVRQKMVLAKRIDEIDKTRLIAESGIKRAMINLKKEAQTDYHALNQGWSNNPSAFKDITVGDGQFSVSYELIDAKEKLPSASGFGLIDEESKINLNRADPLLLTNLFRLLGLADVEAQDLAYSVIDWRDQNSESSVPTGSAEDSYYRNLASPYEAKDADFEVLEELLLVKGFSNEVFEKIRNYVTIYGSGKVNINTASALVLAALGVSQEMIDKIITYRNGKDGVSASADDNIFRSAADLSADLSAHYNLSASELTELTNLTPKITVKSEYFLARSSAKLHNAKFTSRVICILDINGKILSWSES